MPQAQTFSWATIQRRGGLQASASSHIITARRWALGPCWPAVCAQPLRLLWCIIGAADVAVTHSPDDQPGCLQCGMSFSRVFLACRALLAGNLSSTGMASLGLTLSSQKHSSQRCWALVPPDLDIISDMAGRNNQAAQRDCLKDAQSLRFKLAVATGG